MSLSIGLIAVVALVYMAILFAIAFYGDRRRTPLSPRLRAWVYSLSLAVYCTSWTFFGAVGQATDQLWSFLPIYLGPVLLMLFAPWVLQKMIMISKQENITSIADFIAARYGKSQALAVVVALICMVGVLPYIALQLKGIVLGVNLLIGSGADSTGTRAQDTALIVSLVLALFTIVFGTRSLDVTEHHRGMVLAIAFESLVKLTAFLAVGIFVTFGLYDGFADLFSQARAAPQLADYWEETVHWPAMLLQTGVAMTAIMCLPRQFHVTVVENIEPRDLNLARWVFPLYLVLAALFVVPIALAGQLHLPAGVMPDSFVISLPLAEAHPALALLAFIGGASAATGMVIVASVALSTMVSNDMLLPWLLRRREKDTERPFEAFRHWLLTVRRVSIAVILLLAYVAYRLLGSSASLATIGQIAFAAIAQLGPAMIGALYWKQANRRGVFAGLAAGSLLWAYTLVLPVVAKGLGWPLERIPGLTWLASNPFGLPIEPLTQGVLISLVGNFALFGLVSVLSRTRVSEHWQASRFIGQEISQRQNSRFMLAVQVEDLLMLAARFVGEERARQSFIRFAYRQGKGFTPNQTANNEWIAHTERLLAGVLGASSARAVVKAAIEGREMQVEDVVRIADEASEVLQFNRALLQGAIENITQGISVVDQSLRLVAWNHRYLELFEYPDGLIYVGRPIADIIRYNADRGLCGPGDPDMHVAKRLYWMRQGTPHTSERLFPNGRVIELIGNPMPGGGFVMSFTDITAYREAEQGLKGANESLEQRVQERTQELSQLNQELSEAKSNAEAANQSKTRFLAAVSHDLMQPLNAARLFSAAARPPGCAARRGPRPGAASRLLAAFRRGPDHRPAGHLAPGKRPGQRRTQSVPAEQPLRCPRRRIQGAGPGTGPAFPPARQPAAGGQRHQAAATHPAELPDQRLPLRQGPRAARRASRRWLPAPGGLGPGPGHPAGQAEGHLRGVQAPGQPPDPRREGPGPRPGDRRPTLQGPRPSAGSALLAGQGQRLQRPRTAGAPGATGPRQRPQGRASAGAERRPGALRGQRGQHPHRHEQPAQPLGLPGLDRAQPRRVRGVAGQRDASATGIDRLSPGRWRDRHATDGLAAHTPGRTGAGRGDQRRRATGAGGGDPCRRPRLPVQAGQAGRVARPAQPPPEPALSGPQ